MILDADACARALAEPDVISGGSVLRITGDTIEATLHGARIGSIYRVKGRGVTDSLFAEVIGFRGSQTILAPFGEPRGVGPGDAVIPEGATDSQRVGDEWIGRVVDALGRPIDGGPPVGGRHTVPLYRPAPNPFRRKPVHNILETGVSVIDSMLTCGRGQRLGIFAGAGVGKSTLMGMLARQSDADLTILTLVGERGREVRHFLDDILGEEGLKKSIVLVSTGDTAPILRVRLAFLATALAEYFRDQGKNVVLMLDSLTRFATAARELGLAAGEPPATRGFPPSVFSLLPKLIERAGNGIGGGTLTAFYTVLVEGDDMSEPVSDSVRALLDGHYVLSRKKAESGFYPAIDILASISRMAEDLMSPAHAEITQKVRAILAAQNEVADLVQVGAYQPGSDPNIDRAITLAPKLTDCLLQNRTDHRSLSNTLSALQAILATGYEAR